MRVPKDLIHILGREWITSLNTGDYKTALLRHSEEAAKYHLTLVTERAKLAGATRAPEAELAAEQAYKIVKQYFDQRIEAIANTGPTRLEMLLAEGFPTFQRDHTEVLAELDTDLVEMLDADNINGQQRTYRLAAELAQQHGLPTDRGSEFTRILAEQV